jgi:acyl carrier protein
MELEEEFGVTNPDAAADQLNTIEDIIRYLRRRRNDDAA